MEGFQARLLTTVPAFLQFRYPFVSEILEADWVLSDETSSKRVKLTLTLKNPLPNGSNVLEPVFGMNEKSYIYVDRKQVFITIQDESGLKALLTMKMAEGDYICLRDALLKYSDPKLRYIPNPRQIRQLASAVQSTQQSTPPVVTTNPGSEGQGQGNSGHEGGGNNR